MAENGKVDAAVQATTEQVQIKMMQVQLQFGTTGRPFVVIVPADLSPTELLDLIHWIAHPLAGLWSKIEQSQSKPQIEVVRGMPSNLPDKPIQ